MPLIKNTGTCREDDIRKRAFEIYLERINKGEPGDDKQDWLQAEPRVRPASAALPARLLEVRSACFSVFLVLVGLVGAPCGAQSWARSSETASQVSTAKTQHAQTNERPSYRLDRSEEEWSFLRDAKLRTDAWDPIKYIPFGRERWFVSLGGEFRPMYEFYRNYDWGAGPQDSSGYYLNRFIGHSDFHFGEPVRVFLELKSGLVLGRKGGPRPSIHEDKIDLSQLFLDLNLRLGKSRLPLTFRFGRQELNYGEGSLVSIRELNVRREFDGVKLVFRPAGWQVDAFAARPVEVRGGFFDDPPDHAQSFWGLWAKTTKGLPRFLTQFDLYYLGLDRRSARFDQGTARDQRHTLGVNFHGKKGNFSYFVEGDLQFGRFGDGRLLAWKYAQILSYTFIQARFLPVVSLLGAVSSGDKNPADLGLQTFHPLFPKGLYYGYMDFVNGSPNAIVLHPRLTLQLAKTLSLSADSFFFWRQRAGDGVYSQPGFFLRRGHATQARFLGALQNVDLVWRLDKHTTVQFIAAYYEVGPYLRETPPAGKNATYFSAKMNYKF